MPIYLLSDELTFPPPEQATPEGILAVGGDVSVKRLIAAYSQGIFPWPHEGYPLLWFSPDPRFILKLNRVKVGRTLQKNIRRRRYEIRADTQFRQVMKHCAITPRPGQRGTWITREMLEGYCLLHREGIAHSVEAWTEGQLVGGLYGVSLGRMFCGESMFAHASDASKITAVTLFGNLKVWGFDFVDCQVYTDHMARFGAVDWSRPRFLRALKKALLAPTRRNIWRLDLNPQDALEALLRR